MLWKIRKSLGKDYCIIFAVMILLGAICVLFTIDMLPELFVLDIIVSGLGFTLSIVLFLTAFEEPPEEPAPFNYSLDEDGNYIMTNGTQTLYVDGRGNVSSEKPKLSVDTSAASGKEIKTESKINFWLEDQILQREMEIEDSGEELTPVRRLRILKELFNDGDMTLEEYKDKKETVILIYLDDFLEEIDYQETDSEVAFKRKMNYVKSLYQDNLISTEEFESIKAEIMEDMDEEV